jgi:hypothetical protein
VAGRAQQGHFFAGMELARIHFLAGLSEQTIPSLLDALSTTPHARHPVGTNQHSKSHSFLISQKSKKTM